jgi:hypothetical protein
MDAQIKRGVELANRAAELDREKKYEEAIDLYMQACEVFSHVIRYDRNDKSKEILRTRMKSYLDRAETLKVRMRVCLSLCMCVYGRYDLDASSSSSLSSSLSPTLSDTLSACECECVIGGICAARLARSLSLSLSLSLSVRA